MTAGAVIGNEDGPQGKAIHFGVVHAEYTALTAGVGVADFTDRTQIELIGPDRQAFLHNLCTNEVRRLPAGAGCEAFFCNPQGHVLAFVHIFCGGESLVIETVAGEEAKLMAHLDRYLIREKVELRRAAAIGPNYCWPALARSSCSRPWRSAHRRACLTISTR